MAKKIGRAAPDMRTRSSALPAEESDKAQGQMRLAGREQALSDKFANRLERHGVVNHTWPSQQFEDWGFVFIKGACLMMHAGLAESRPAASSSSVDSMTSGEAGVGYDRIACGG